MREAAVRLIVTFVSGKTYAYGLVPKHVYDDFRRSGAKGNFFISQIRAAATRRGASAGGPHRRCGFQAVDEIDALLLELGRQSIAEAFEQDRLILGFFQSLGAVYVGDAAELVLREIEALPIRRSS